MNLKDYPKYVEGRLSPDFHISSVTVPALYLAVDSASHAGSKLDELKRSMFYHGKPVEGVPPEYEGKSLKMAADNTGLTTKQFHSIIGILTEAAEFADALKESLTNVKTNVDMTNLVEEAGDLLFYIQGLFPDKTLDELVAVNVAKLDARYPTKVFTAEDAVNRDVAHEKAVMDAALDKA